MKDFITLALSKGRLLSPSITLLKKIGISQPSLQGNSRKLLFDNKKSGIRIVIVRAVDVPTYVEYGAADIGIAGRDILMEHDRDVYEPLDLQIGRCRLILARPETADPSSEWPRTKMRIATKYPRITEAFFNKKGIPVEIIRLSGAIELAPSVGLAERIVDLVTTGKTLRENHLVEEALIVECTAHLIVNRASLKTKMKQVMSLVERFQNAVKDQNQ